MRVITVILSSLMVLAASTTLLGQAGIPWVHSFETGQQLAQRDGRPMLIHFYADWCGPCRSLEQTVFSDANVGHSLAAQYIPVKINVDQHQELAQRYNVRQIPADVIVDSRGRVVYQTLSPTDPQRYLQLLHGVAAEVGRGTTVQPVATQAGQQLGPPAAASSVDPSAWGGASEPPNVDDYCEAQRPADTAWGGARGWQDRADAAVTANSFETQAGRQDAWRQSTWQGAAANQAPAQPGAPQNSPIDEPPAGVASTAPQAAEQTNPYAPPANRAPSAPQAAEQPPLQFPLALDGYCAVTLAEQEQWQRGNQAWGAIHRGRTYLFTSQEQQQRFLADPDRYSPVLSGLDPTQYVDAGEPIPGLRQHGMWFRGKIYLFADEASLERFSRNPEYYAQRAHEIMMMAGR